MAIDFDNVNMIVDTSFGEAGEWFWYLLRVIFWVLVLHSIFSRNWLLYIAYSRVNNRDHVLSSENADWTRRRTPAVPIPYHPRYADCRWRQILPCYRLITQPRGVDSPCCVVAIMKLRLYHIWTTLTSLIYHSLSFILPFILACLRHYWQVENKSFSWSL